MIAAAVFVFGLWMIEGDEQYARAAADILVAWGGKLENFDIGDNEYLTAGLQGH